MVAGSTRDAQSQSETAHLPVCHALQFNQALPGGDFPGVETPLCLSRAERQASGQVGLPFQACQLMPCTASLSLPPPCHCHPHVIAAPAPMSLPPPRHCHPHVSLQPCLFASHVGTPAACAPAVLAEMSAPAACYLVAHLLLPCLPLRPPPY